MMTKNNLPLISIIVPVYNAAQYLSQCIESILAQTYTHFELLLLDDGSKDNSLEICNDYAKQDARIKVLSHPNMGVSATRNRGIEIAQGEYISFVDSDDWVKSSYLQVLYDALHPNLGRGLVIAGFERCSKDNITPVSLPTVLINNNQIGEIVRSFFYSNVFYISGKLFDKSLISQNKLRFMIEISCCEDLFFILDFAINSDYLNIINDNIYSYRVNEKPESLSVKIYSFEHEILVLDGLLQRLEQYQAKGFLIEKDMVYASRTITVFLHKIIISIYKNHYTSSVRLMYLRLFINKYHKSIVDFYHPDYLVDKLGALFLKTYKSFLFNIWQTFLFRIRFPKMYGA